MLDRNGTAVTDHSGVHGPVPHSCLWSRQWNCVVTDSSGYRGHGPQWEVWSRTAVECMVLDRIAVRMIMDRISVCDRGSGTRDYGPHGYRGLGQ